MFKGFGFEGLGFSLYALWCTEIYGPPGMRLRIRGLYGSEGPGPASLHETPN